VVCKKESRWVSDKFEDSQQNCPETCVSDVFLACYRGVTSESVASVR
jgi:hypothetical protein